MLRKIIASSITSPYLFSPIRDYALLPSSIGLPFFNISLVCADKLKLSGWFLPNPNQHKTALLFYGNGGNMSYFLEVADWLYKNQLSVLMVDYPGFGNSEGSPSITGLYEASIAAYNYLIEQRFMRVTEIIALGYSMGGAVATNLAANRAIRGLILLNAMSRPYFPERKPISHFNFSPSLYTEQTIPYVKNRTLILQNKMDRIVSPDTAVRLYNASNSWCELYLLTEGNHNSPEINNATSVLRRFLSESVR